MSNERWNSPFSYTFAFALFRKHFTEINQVYWSFIPASNTIISNAKKALKNDDADPKTFFLIPDEDDRRIANTFGEWKNHYKEFSNYTRLNMVMLLSACFETYLRTVVSNAFESKPGVIIMCKDSVDGLFLLKNKPGYGDINNKNYQFSEEVDEICRGDWEKRFAAFEKYFGTPPANVLLKISELNELRIVRNNIGHYIGRTRSDYSAPSFFLPISATRVSHNRVIKYFKLIDTVAKEIDDYLRINYIGSYDVIKYYFHQVSQGNFSDIKPGVKAREFQRLLGNEGFPPVGNAYYRNIISYCDLDGPDDLCRYSKKTCLKEINRQLTTKGIPLVRDGHAIRFGQYHFNLFVRARDWKSNPEYCQKNHANTKQIEYRYSAKVICEIVESVEAHPDSIIERLKGK